HPGRDGRMTNWYSTGVSGTERELRRHVKEARLEDVVALGKRNALTERTLAQFQRGSPRRVTLAGVRDEWEDWMVKVGKAPRSIETCLQNFDRWLATHKIANKNPMEVGFDDIYPVVNPEDSPVKAKTRSIRLFALRTLYEYLCANNYVAGNPAAAVRVRNDLLTHGQKEVRRIESFTVAEYRRFLSYLDAEIAYADALVREREGGPPARQKGRRVNKPYARRQWLHFFRFATVVSWEIGLRLGDICQLEWLCFASPGEIVVHTDKRDTRIAVPMSPDMEAALRRVPADDLDYLFPEQNRLIRSKSRSRPSEYFRKELEACGITGKTFHALRHTCIRRMKKELETNGDDLTPDEILRRIGRVVAHANPSTTKGYL
ncbi:MAG: tyrosine-type recombinase/integrase, partial [Opitutales bacterium]